MSPSNRLFHQMPAFAPRDSLKWFPQASHLCRFSSLFVCSGCWLIKQMFVWCHVLQKCVCYLKPSVFNPWAHSLLSFAFQTLWRGALQMAHQVRFLSFLLFCVGVRERGWYFVLLWTRFSFVADWKSHNNHNQKTITRTITHFWYITLA